jgi:hypothetical protein
VVFICGMTNPTGIRYPPETRRVPDTRPKPDEYGYGYEFLPVGTGTGTNFYLQPLYWRAGNYSPQSKPDPLPSLNLWELKYKWIIYPSQSEHIDHHRLPPPKSLSHRQPNNATLFLSTYRCRRREAAARLSQSVLLVKVAFQFPKDELNSELNSLLENSVICTFSLLRNRRCEERVYKMFAALAALQ